MALAGLLVVLHAGMDMKTTIAGKHPWLLFTLAPTMRPRMLLTLDTQGQLLSCPVRVGQAVDVVAQVRPGWGPTRHEEINETMPDPQAGPETVHRTALLCTAKIGASCRLRRCCLWQLLLQAARSVLNQQLPQVSCINTSLPLAPEAL